jgi:hypothetical protein
MLNQCRLGRRSWRRLMCEPLEQRMLLSVADWSQGAMAPVTTLNENEPLWADVNSPGESQTPTADARQFVSGEILVGFEGGVVVAVVDTGVDLNHPDLDENLLKDAGGNIVGGTFLSGAMLEGGDVGSDAKGGNPGPPPKDGGGASPGQDDNGHGTHVAGIIAGEINNMGDLATELAGNPECSGGTVGVAPQAKIMPVKVLTASGSGSDADIAEGIIFAADNGADIINMSLGGPYSATMHDAIEYAYQVKDVLVISSAGNSNRETSGHPASDAYSMSIAAVDSDDVRASFSNYGFSVDVAAPGVSVLSSFIDLTDDGESGQFTGAYGRLSGTSMAAPVAAGVAALIQAAHPEWAAADVAAQLLAAADPIDALNPGYEGKLGAGRVHASSALGPQATAPRVIAVGGLGAEGGQINRLEVGATISVQYSHVMDDVSVLDGANYQLLYLGDDGAVGGDDDVPVALSMVTATYDAFPGRGVQLMVAEDAPEGNYRFRVVSGGVVSSTEAALDGDPEVDGTEDYVRSFTLSAPALSTQFVAPVGSLIYQGETTDLFNAPIDVLWVGPHSTAWTGYAVTQISVSEFETFATPANLNKFDVLYVDASARQTDPNGLAILQARADEIAAFVQSGGGLITDTGGDFNSPDFSWVPYGDQLAWTAEHQDSVVLTTYGSTHPVTSGLTNGGLSGWGNSQHNYFDATAAMDVLATDPDGQANVLADDYGSGRVVYFGLDPTYHQPAGETRELIRQAIRWAAEPSTQQLSPAEDVDKFVLQLDGDPDQLVTLEVSSPAGLGSVTLTHAGTDVTPDDGDPDPNVVRYTNVDPLSGSLTIFVTAPDGRTAGEYAVHVWLNTALEEEGNNDFDSAQDIDGRFITLAGGTSSQRGAVLGVLSAGIADGVTVVEDFEHGDMGSYTEVGKDPSNASITAAGAHDGDYGLEDRSNYGMGGWIYRDDITVQQGDVISVWIKSLGTPTGRGYFGFGATDAGALSITMAPNTNELLLTEHRNYKYKDFGSVPQTWLADHWYRMEVDWKTTGEIVGNLYDSDGTTLLNTVTGSSDLFTSGGIAFRSFDSTKFFDTVMVTSSGTPFYAPNPDVYSFSLGEGESAAVALTALGEGSLDLEVWDDPQSSISPTLTASNVDAVIELVAEAAGTYYARVSGGGSAEDVPYSLVVTRNALFDLESNDDEVAAQDLTQRQVALGAITRSMPAGPADWVTVEGFEDGNLVEYTELGTSNASVTEAAAYADDDDMTPAYGLEDRANSGLGGWLYRDEATVRLQRGDMVSVWVRSDGEPTDRGYFGFGATDTGTLTMVMAPNTGNLLIQRNAGYGYEDLGASPQVWLADHWYRMEVDWDASGIITGRLYDDDGVTLLNTVSGYDDTITAGGIAFRSFGSTKFFDTVQTGALDDDVYKITLAEGESRTVQVYAPGGGPGEFSNNLDPGLVVTCPDSSEPTIISGPGGHIVTLEATATGAGDYYLRVSAENGAKADQEVAERTGDDRRFFATDYADRADEKEYAEDSASPARLGSLQEAWERSHRRRLTRAGNSFPMAGDGGSVTRGTRGNGASIRAKTAASVSAPSPPDATGSHVRRIAPNRIRQRNPFVGESYEYRDSNFRKDEHRITGRGVFAGRRQALCG